MKKSLIAIMLAFAIVSVTYVPAVADTEIAEVEGTKVPVFVDNKPIKFGNAMVVEGTTYVPINPVFEQMGYKVNYDAKTMTVKMTKGNSEITVGVSANTIGGVMEVNGEMQNVSGFISNSYRDVNGVTLIPVRSVTENLFCDVVWDGTNVWVYSPAYDGEKKENEIKAVPVVTNEAYFTAVTQILNKQDLNNNVDHLELGNGVAEEIKDFNTMLKLFIRTAQSGDGYEKDKKNYKGILLDTTSPNWQKLDILQAYVVILHKHIERLKWEGLVDNANVLITDINEIYMKARS